MHFEREAAGISIGTIPASKIWTVSWQYLLFTRQSVYFIIRFWSYKGHCVSRFICFFFSPKQGKFNSYVVQVFPRKHDNLLKYTPACRQYRREWNKYMNSSKIQRINHEHRHLFQYLEKHSGTPICTIGDVKYLHDTLSTEKYLNKTYVHFTLVTNKN